MHPPLLSHCTHSLCALFVAACSYLDLLQSVRGAPDEVLLPKGAHRSAAAGDKAAISATKLRRCAEAADVLAALLKLWRTQSILCVDEVDQVLHPLKSELNFPIGACLSQEAPPSLIHCSDPPLLLPTSSLHPAPHTPRSQEEA